MLKNNYDYYFFDLDGTLLSMNTDKFVEEYFKAMAKHLAKYGFDAVKVIYAIQYGTKAMLKNDGSCTNEQTLWKAFCEICVCDLEKLKQIMDKFYQEEFDKLKALTQVNKDAIELISKLKSNGQKLVLATNPLFPKIATEKRITWAGLNKEDFEIITTFENEGYSKPNLKYFEGLLKRLNTLGKFCIMIGNDVDEDMCAKKLDFDVYLVTDNLNNKSNKDINNYCHGSFKELESLLFNN